MSPLKERVRQALHEEVVIVPYDRCWAARYRREAARLRRMFGSRLIRRIEHFGSTAVPGLAAKPIIDMLVEVPSLRAAKLDVAPVLCAAGYEYFWRPTFGDNVPPWYAFFIKRNRKGERTHHIHMVTCPRVFQEHWDRLLFRDYLVANPKFSRKYANLKRRLANEHPKIG